ncbi:MAG: outer membrane lipid asymmetry maintenance protein MlaD [Rickettsiales bacterium]|jgi:phospholipid/cholesterol/gamma-HCH transport system substrate-binding protein|nr:outer membrane lipid asymmetry maintenance protein MlaD [Rickettsiales bacterium]
MKNNKFETIIGAIVLLIAVLFFMVILNISKNTSRVNEGYVVSGEFNNVEGLTIGSDVKISGVKIGTVTDITLNKTNYKAIVFFGIENDLKIPTDSIFKVSSSGLMGGKFVNIKIGGMNEYLENKDIVDFTESTMDLEDLISRFVFNSGNKNEKK